MTHATQQTSLFAYKEVRRSKNPSLSDRQKAVMDELRKQPNMTNGEIAASLHAPAHTITPRIYELREKNRVEKACQRACRVTGKTCIAWKLKLSTVTPYTE